MTIHEALREAVPRLRRADIEQPAAEAELLLAHALGKDAAGLPAHAVYIGGCLLDGRFFDLDPARLPSGEFGLPHTLEKHLDTIPVHVLEATFWMPVGTPEELEAAKRRSARP